MAARDHSRLFFVHLQVRVVRVLVDVVFIIRIFGILVGDETEPTHVMKFSISLFRFTPGAALSFSSLYEGKNSFLNARAFSRVVCVYIYIYIVKHNTQQHSIHTLSLSVCIYIQCARLLFRRFNAKILRKHKRAFRRRAFRVSSEFFSLLRFVVRLNPLCI